MDRRAFVTSLLSPLGAALGCAAPLETSPPQTPGLERGGATSPAIGEATDEGRRRARQAMKRATRYACEVVGKRGAFVWSYLPDFSRCWGEIEARPSMLWVQPPGTPTVGHCLLDAYQATGDGYYLDAATDVARALIQAQHPSGGWNYVYDFAGAASLAEWYDTVARNAWRLEEFHIHPDNATFDDAGTAHATQLLLRLRLERPFPELEAAVDRALGLVTQSQYPGGGWPQRFPLQEDYTRFVTFNDDVFGENVRTLLMARHALRRAELSASLERAMDSVAAMQQPAPQPGWGLQHTLDGRPAAARSFEPAALATHTTAANVALLIDFHALTGNARFTARAPEAIAWLRRVALPPELGRRLGGTHPTFIRVGDDRPLYVHRRGSNVVNGEYYVDESVEPRLAHYSGVRALDVDALERRLRRVQRGEVELGCLDGDLGSVPLPRFFTLAASTLPELCGANARPPRAASAEQAARTVASLDEQGRWLSPLELVTNPYRAPGSAEPYAGDAYVSTNVGDRSDTSPYRPEEAPETYAKVSAPLGISMLEYVSNMATLIAFASRG